jgi:hypothetical protein
MRSYLVSKPPSQLDPSWINLSLSNFTSLDPKSEEVVALLYITHKREIGVIFKPTPVKSQDRNFEGIIGNMFLKKHPCFIKIDAEEVSSCYVIQD